MNNLIDNIKDCYEGMMVSCTIQGTNIDEARIVVPQNNGMYIYICQNYCNGNEIGDKYGFDYSWAVQYDFVSGELFFTDYNISNFRKDPDSDKLILDEGTKIKNPN